MSQLWSDTVPEDADKEYANKKRHASMDMPWQYVEFEVAGHAIRRILSRAPKCYGTIRL